MIDRLINSVDYRFWVVLAFWLGCKLALAVGILAVVAFTYLGVNSALLLIIVFLPLVIWITLVFRNLALFSRAVRRLLKIK